MNSGLLNIWREIGSYLRYGDAKCIFLSGVSFGLLFSFVQFKLIDGNVSWEVLSRLAYSNINAIGWIAIIAFGMAFLVCVLAVIPSLSKGTTRVNFLNGIGRFFSLGDNKVEERAVVYFRDISLFKSASDYESAIKKAMNVSEELNAAEKELSEQIWIIARIATSKFVAANIAVIAILIGLACSVW